MEYKELTNKMVEYVPELKSAYDEEMEWIQEDLPHLIFVLVFNPSFERLLRSGEDTPQLRRMCEFIELMATSSDLEVLELLSVTILEFFVVERDIANILKQKMGPTTKSKFETLESLSGY